MLETLVMKKIFILSILIVTVVSCNKFERNLEGTWVETRHVINDIDYTTGDEEFTFESNGTYTSNKFTYPWHCYPCADTPDSGEWTYDKSSSKLTFKSTKNQTVNCNNNQFTFQNSTQEMNVISHSRNEIILEFVSVLYDQNVELTLEKKK